MLQFIQHFAFFFFSCNLFVDAIYLSPAFWLEKGTVDVLKDGLVRGVLPWNVWKQVDKMNEKDFGR